MNTTIAQQIANEGGVEAYLHAQQHKSLLRFLTCGSVDDGKSTLIGRLLHDTRQIYEDQLSSLHNDSKRHGTQGEKLDLALLVDGLQAEREQGITIDVAYRYFSTEKRKFIIADTPGHEQYTRNMATGASTCDLAILLIDARKGVLDQTRRHSFISTLLGIKHLVVAVNKMDLVEFSEARFNEIREAYLTFAEQLPGNLDIRFVPLSALEGDNVASQSANMPWYSGPTLLEVLETVEIQRVVESQPLRFPVQYVNRPNLDFRGFSGTVASGTVQVGQRLKVLPSGVESSVARIVTFDGDLQEAAAGEAITIVLKDEIDISRGDLLVDAQATLPAVQSASIDVVWMAEQTLTPGQSYDIKIAGKKTRARVDAIRYQVDINNLTQREVESLPLNGIGLVELTFDEPLVLDPYQQNPVLHNDSKRHGTQGEKLDLALLVDGLQAEREQGITIDVAYRYFSTEKRKFIIADTPGHEQYTRNMATGASTCDLAILLIDARKGVLDQTRRHSFISTLLGIKHLVVAVNKMDLVEFSEARFNEIREDYLTFAEQLPGNLDIRFVPLSALEGDNVASQSANIPWYSGPTLLEVLETVEIQRVVESQPLRFPVQYVNRPNLDFRGFSGTVASGTVTVGQRLKVLPSGVESSVARIVTFDGDLQEAAAGEAITLVLKDEIDISRGDLLVDAQASLPAVQSASIDVVWMAEQPLTPGQSYDIKIAGKKTRARVDAIRYQVDINNLTQREVESLPLNGIGLVELTFDEPLVLDPYQQNPVTGGLIFIDRLTNVTVGAGMVNEPHLQASTSASQYSAFELELNQLIRKHFPHWDARDLLGGK